MDFNTLAILFIAFSVISSVFRKWQEKRSMFDRDSRPNTDGPRRAEFEVEEIDLSERDIFRAPDPVELPAEPIREFRDISGKRPVSEEDTGPEFQEVRGATPVSEADTGPEFVDPLKDDETYRADPAVIYAKPGDVVVRVDDQAVVSEEIRWVSGQTPEIKVGKRRLRFDKDALINGILYQEILGSPRSERMP